MNQVGSGQGKTLHVGVCRPSIDAVPSYLIVSLAQVKFHNLYTSFLCLQPLTAVIQVHREMDRGSCQRQPLDQTYLIPVTLATHCRVPRRGPARPMAGGQTDYQSVSLWTVGTLEAQQTGIECCHTQPWEQM